MVRRTLPAESVIGDLPASIAKYSSEYHYLFSVLFAFHNSGDKANLELLLSVPNAVRRFVELYTYARIPADMESTVDQRAEELFGVEEAKRLLKLLHYYSHGNNIERLTRNPEHLADVEVVVAEVLNKIKQADPRHFAALEDAIK